MVVTHIARPWRNAAVTSRPSAVFNNSEDFLPQTPKVDGLLAKGSSLTILSWQNNGQPCSAKKSRRRSARKDLILQVDGLNPENAMMFAMVAVNEEYVSATEYITFSTAAAAPVKAVTCAPNMPGKYIASTTTATGAP